MAIEKYISDLLYRYECVILPGFGAFITHHESARILVESNQFLPPQKSVSFNRQLTKNDGLLANHIVEVEKIPYRQAVDVLSAYVGDLKNLLKESKAVELSGLGSFSLSKEDKLQFEPLAEKNYLKEAFGLSPYTSHQIDRQPSQEQQQVEESPVVLTPKTKSLRPYFKYAAIGLIAIGLSGFTGLNLYEYQVNEHNLAEQQKAESALGTQIQQATFVIDNPLPSITLNVNRQSGKYHVVAGAFRMESNAEKRVEELKAEGYMARQIGANKYGLHQVVYFSFEDRIQALKALREIKRTSNSGSWLLVQEL